jgi:hypothetical protein
LNSALNTQHSAFRLASNRKLHALLGGLKRIGMDTDDIKSIYARDVSHGRTEHSSELTDAEHQQLVGMVEQAARAMGQTGPTDPTSQTSPTRPRLPRGVPIMRTPKQERVLEQLWLRLGYSVASGQSPVGSGQPEKPVQSPFDRLLKEVPTSQKSRAKIDELKSRLCRHEIEATILGTPTKKTLQLWCNFVLGACGPDLPVEEQNVLDQVGRAQGREINSLPAGGVIWARDIVARCLGIA